MRNYHNHIVLTDHLNLLFPEHLLNHLSILRIIISCYLHNIIPPYCPPCTYHIVNPFTCSFLYICIIVSIMNLIIKFWTSLEKSKVPPGTTPMLIFSLRTIFILCSGFKRRSILIQIIRHLSQF